MLIRNALCALALLATLTPPPAVAQNGGDTILFLPIVSRTSGLADTRWSSSVWIYNPTTQEATIALEWYPSSPAGLPGPEAVETVTVAAGAQHFIQNVVADLYGDTGNGAIRMVADQAVKVFVRVFNDKTFEPYDGGTFGQGFNALSPSAPVSRGVFVGLSFQSPSHQAGYRTNIGMFNPGADPVTLNLHAWAEDGALLGETTRRVEGYSHLQGAVYDLIWSVPQAARERDHLVVTYEVEGGPLLVYASVVDNVTGDGVLRLPQAND